MFSSIETANFMLREQVCEKFHVRLGHGLFLLFDCWDDKDGVGYRIDKVIEWITMPLESLATPNDGSNIESIY